MWHTIDESARKLRKLSGMKYHGGHDRQHWIDVTGIDPATVVGIKIIRTRYGVEMCYWTPQAEKACMYDETQNNYALLGIATA